MSVLASLADGDPCPIEVCPAGCVADLLAAVHEALALPCPAHAYDMRLLLPDGTETQLAKRMAEPMADVEVRGCEERVVVRLKPAHVARRQLATEGVTTADAARTALDEALRAGSLDRIARIAAAALTDIAPRVADAIVSGDTAAAEAMLNAAERGASLPQRTVDDLLRSACTAGAVGVIPRLLDLGADVHTLDCRQEAPALHVAARAGHVHVVELLLAHGGDVASRDAVTDTPLHVAARAGQTAAAQVLLAHGAEVDADNRSGNTPLGWAAAESHAAMITLLMEHGADANHQNHIGQPPLQIACHGSRTNAAAPDAARALLAGGVADINATGEYQRTPLHEACVYGSPGLVTVFLDHSADVNARGKDGETALHMVCGCECLASAEKMVIARLLVDGGAALEAADYNDDGPLHVAIVADEPVLVRYLLEAGAAVNARGDDGDTPLDVARALEIDDIAELLVQYGGKEAAAVLDDEV